ncbi:hypothetical protein P13BB106kb_p079 [Pectobacterium phage DU_PP_V]|uniref:Uncharacterized protein n=1 Tax=Pectobacterium phage DU_PP_V TaxID=2041492 RepID=A0A2D2W763_9CAUD|nr:hypothetical protein HOS40_gp090 [Pectobacterium phage DU_PP_V]ATS94063.1 hypothetical protein P13BB106kb_p079 [Pectobacterium phage DU_PP_V]
MTLPKYLVVHSSGYSLGVAEYNDALFAILGCRDIYANHSYPSVVADFFENTSSEYYVWSMDGFLGWEDKEVTDTLEQQLKYIEENFKVFILWTDEEGHNGEYENITKMFYKSARELVTECL